MPDKGKYITKNSPLPIAQDMAALRAEGIRLSQQFSGDLWTDFNDHDPGVTVLENLCYIITESSYKANLDFEQLFFVNQDAESKVNLEDYFLLEQNKVQYTNPVTPLDYRKLFLDHFDEQILKNVWVVGKTNFDGEYVIYIHTEQESVKGKLDILYNNYRNFGEKCDEIVILKAISVENLIEINETVVEQWTEDIVIESVAEFLDDIKVFLEPRVRYAKSINDLGLDEEGIIQLQQGPTPFKKFINPEDLSTTSLEEMEEEIDIATFIDQNSSKWNNLISIESSDGNRLLKMPRVNVEERTVVTFNEGRFLEKFDDPLRSKLIDAYQLRSGRPILNGIVEWDSFEPKSSLLKKDLTDYYSIQYTFPQNYNLGLEDLSMLDMTQQKQIKNLQNYLLIFESLLVDFLVKLISFPELLKIKGRAKHADVESQFLELLRKIPGNPLNKEQTLGAIYSNYSFDKAKQIQIREYALNRYGETFDTNLLQAAWGVPENFEDQWLTRLNQLMLHYTEYSQGRHCSFDVRDPNTDFPLSRKLSILLNEDYDEKAPNVYIIEANLLDEGNKSSAHKGGGEMLDNNPFKVAIIVDLKSNTLEFSGPTGVAPEDTGGNLRGHSQSRRQNAIINLIKEELPFHLHVSEGDFWFLVEGKRGKLINKIGDVFIGNVGGKQQGFFLNRNRFMQIYAAWRQSLSQNLRTENS